MLDKTERNKITELKSLVKLNSKIESLCMELEKYGEEQRCGMRPMIKLESRNFSDLSKESLTKI